MLSESVKRARFEQVMLPHLDSSYNLARWLMRNDHDAEDAVQEAYLRAYRFFEGFQGGDGKAWLLAIVRNTCRTFLQKSGGKETMTKFDDSKHSAEFEQNGPEERLLRQAEVESVHACIDKLPTEYREVVVMRELEQLSYKEIATAVAVPIGTVMSRLARARARLHECLQVRIRGARA